MKFSKGLTLVLCLLVAMILVASAVAQETTAGLQGTIKDPQGAVVSGANVEVSGPALIGVKKVTTDAGGYYRFANLPPGTYAITVTAQGFRGLKQEGLDLKVGALPTVDLKLEVGGVEQTIEVSSAAPIVDVAQSKVQTNVTAAEIQAVPKGRSFQSLIQFAPGARNEPLQGGYQIDGASNSENSYLVEGQETSSIRTGASTTDVPMEFIQEVQVKTSGFEAEYGGALGGVVNVIQKRGGNAWHGSVFTSYRGDFFNAAPSHYARKDPQDLGNAATRLDQATQYYQPKKDHWRIVNPGFELGGYLMKDRLWLFSSFVPEYSTLRRTVNLLTAPRSFDQTYQQYFAYSRADYLVNQKIRVYGSWQLGYKRLNGNSLPTADDAYGLYNNSITTGVDGFNYGIGYVQPNTIYGTGADITITPNLVATTRYGYTFADYQDRGRPTGINYIYRNTNYSYGGIAAGEIKDPETGEVIGVTSSLQGTPLPNAFWKDSGYGTIGPGGVNSSYIFDKYKRQGFSQDAAYFKKGWGTHNFKFGYGFNRLENNVINGYNTAQAYVAFDTAYAPLGANRPTCAAISAQNITLYGTSGVTAEETASGSACTGLWGTVNFREYGETGKVSSMNHSLYVQDAWTMGGGVTLNIGYRFDKESLPSYAEGLPGINFGFTDKAAPRIGGSWDVFRNGKLKVYGSFGYFYDIMKYEMPRGSFGGNWWHDCVYAMDTYDWTTFIPTRGGDGHFCPKTGPANGTLPNLRFIENQDYRTYSNDPNQPGAFKTGMIDPNLKPMKQHELVFGADWALSPTMAFESRYSRKRLDDTIEDAGIITPFGEQFYIINPGKGINVQPIPSTDCTDCPVQPVASRRYDALELRMVRRNSAKWGGTVSYTYSRLYGNYSGLTATDVSDGGAARQSPNVDRAFDEPYMQFDAHGRVVDGPLATDRPHTVKAYGYYRLKWWKMETLLGGYQQWYSGTPLSTYIGVDGAPVFLEGRGKFADVTRTADGTWVLGNVSERRGDKFSQTDFNLVQEFHVSKSNENMVLGFEANVINLFNQHSATVYSQNLLGAKGTQYIIPDVSVPETSVSETDYHTLMTGYNYVDVANGVGRWLNSAYGMPTTFQDGRQMRFKIRFTF